jgi:uncharacterized protein YjdB
MKRNYKSRILIATTAAFFTMSCLTQILTRNVYATSNVQELLITEVMPMSQSVNDAYEYIELYNNSDRNIDLKDYKLPLQNMDITASKVIAPKGILIVCTKGSTTLDNFNTFYNTTLTADRYITLPFADEVLSNNSSASIILSNDDSTVVVKAQYYSTDFQAKKGVNFKYAETGVDMLRLALNQSPTPGSISSEQVRQGEVKVTGITLDKSSITMDVNQTAAIYATVAPATASNKSIIWTSTDTSVVTVNQNGILTSKAEGVVNVTATTVDGGIIAVCTVFVKKIPVTGITLDKTTVTMDVNQTAVLNATVAPALATNKAIAWTSGNTNIVEVSQKGVLTSKTEGAVYITATTVDGGFVAGCTVIVRRIPVTGITLDKTLITMDVNQTAVLNPTIAPVTATNKSIAWASYNSNIAEVSQKGVVTSKAEGTVNITATTVDGGVVAFCTVVVKKIPVTGVNLDKTNLTIEVGKSISLKASIAPVNATNKLVNFESSNSSIASVDSKGVVVGKSVGVATITVKTNEGNFTNTCVITVKNNESTDTNKSITSIRLNKTSIQIKEGKFEQLTPIITPGNLKKTGFIWKSSNDKIAYVTDDGRVYGRKEGNVIITVTTKNGTKDGIKATCKVEITNGKEKGKDKGKGK